MSIVFFGTTDTGWHCLAEMIKAGLPVRGIVTMAQEFEISYAKNKVQNLRHRSFQNFQTESGIPLLTFTRKFDHALVQTIASWQPRLLVVIGWYHMIPARVRDLISRAESHGYRAAPDCWAPRCAGPWLNTALT